MHQAEGLRVVEGCHGQDGHRIPCQAVGDLGLIAALVAVGPHGIAGLGIKVREELADKAVGDAVVQLLPQLFSFCRM